MMQGVFFCPPTSRDRLKYWLIKISHYCEDVWFMLCCNGLVSFSECTVFLFTINSLHSLLFFLKCACCPLLCKKRFLLSFSYFFLCFCSSSTSIWTIKAKAQLHPLLYKQMIWITYLILIGHDIPLSHMSLM